MCFATGMNGHRTIKRVETVLGIGIVERFNVSSTWDRQYINLLYIIHNNYPQSSYGKTQIKTGNHDFCIFLLSLNGPSIPLLNHYCRWYREYQNGGNQ